MATSTPALALRRLAVGLAVCSTACSLSSEEISHTRHAVTDPADGAPPCRVLDFDVDGDGDPIDGGDVLAKAYEPIGVTIRVRRRLRRHWGRRGLPVAFDTDNPTGGDDDLGFSGQGNALISQECFRRSDVLNGFVAEPDDDRHGAKFTFRFDEPQCIPSLTLLDIDYGESPVVIRMYNAAHHRVLEHHVPPGGDNERIEVSLPPTERCDVVKMTIALRGSGAIDDVEMCGACPGGGLPTEWYLDADADGYGDPAELVVACEAPDRYVDNAMDCDDGDDAISPDAAEMCDGMDNDCNGEIDEPGAVDEAEWYTDADGDGYGDASLPVAACDQPAGTSISDDDCDDTDAAINPGMVEIVNGVDDDCNGIIDG